MKITSKSIPLLALLPGQREKTFFCDDLPGFGVRVRAGGSKVFVVQYKHGAKHRRLTLGAVDTLDLTKARATARDLLAAVRLGHDPVGEKIEARQRAAETFGALLPRYLARQRVKLKPRSYLETERHLLAHAKPLHTRAVKSIDRRMIAARLSEIADTSGPYAANRVRASLSTYFMWLAREGLIETNVVANTNRAPENGARSRVLGDDELRDIWNAAGDNRYAGIVRLLMLTAARRDEIGSLSWSEVDRDAAVIMLPPERMKNRRRHDIPLSPPALTILQAQPRQLASDGSTREFVFGGVGRSGFQGWSKSKAELDARLLATREAAGKTPIPEWRLHDLRRTASTVMHDRLGIAPHYVEAVLGHVSGHKAGVAGVYNYARYEIEKRNALARWAEYLMGIIEEREQKVIPLRPESA
jgi:integrase